MIEQQNLRFKCNFCGALFYKASECAKHIEEESISKICFPSDILMVDITKEQNNDKDKYVNDLRDFEDYMRGDE